MNVQAWEAALTTVARLGQENRELAQRLEDSQVTARRTLEAHRAVLAENVELRQELREWQENYRRDTLYAAKRVAELQSQVYVLQSTLSITTDPDPDLTESFDGNH